MQRGKWFTSQADIKIGDLVLVKEDGLSPSKWALGRIVETFLGDDGHVRVATIRCSNSIIKRSIVKLALLPNQDVQKDGSSKAELN